MRKIIAYLCYVSGLMLLVHYGVNHQEELRIIAGRNYNPLPSILFSYVYSVMIGKYIALPRLISSLRMKGKLSVNWLKILIIGMPTLLISASGILSYYFVSSPLKLIGWVYVKYNMMGATLIGVACGYTLLNSIAKKAGEETLHFWPVQKIQRLSGP